MLVHFCEQKSRLRLREEGGAVREKRVGARRDWVAAGSLRQSKRPAPQTQFVFNHKKWLSNTKIIDTLYPIYLTCGFKGQCIVFYHLHKLVDIHNCVLKIDWVFKQIKYFRTLAISMLMTTGRIGSMVANVLFPILLDKGCVVPFYSIAAIMFCKYTLIWRAGFPLYEHARTEPSRMLLRIT